MALSTPDGRARPVARLIDPGERTRPVVGSGMGMSFAVKAGLLDVGVEKPPGAGPERAEWIVRGHGASQPNPQWEFRQVKGFSLVGDHPVAALVELVPYRLNTAEVLVAAELEHRSWGSAATGHGSHRRHTPSCWPGDPATSVSGLRGSPR
ncbi:hypothetical protein QBA38_21635 [Streptomyces stelliscabiei]|uniref:hypothetical protein n=1 Tax=Streptomyces stelliscabiei TaxID=146820 RepID=UPI002FF03666